MKKPYGAIRITPTLDVTAVVTAFQPAVMPQGDSLGRVAKVEYYLIDQQGRAVPHDYMPEETHDSLSRLLVAIMEQGSLFDDLEDSLGGNK